MSYRRVQYRIPYFFHEDVAVLAHGIVKEARVPDTELERARRRRDTYVTSPRIHTYRELR